jgi:hypothetical protein
MKVTNEARSILGLRWDGSGVRREALGRVERRSTVCAHGHATPLHLAKMRLQYADHWLEVMQRVASEVMPNKYGFVSNSKAMRPTSANGERCGSHGYTWVTSILELSVHASRAGAIIELMDVQLGP